MTAQLETKNCMTEYLTLVELCFWLRVKPAYVYDLTHRKTIPFCKVGKHLRFPRSSVESWLRDPEGTLAAWWGRGVHT